MSEYQLYLGDCLEVMKQLPDASVDMVLAEPAEHFEIMAQEWMDDADNLRQHAIKLTAQRDELLADLQVAASTLRRYEQAHRAKGTADSTVKAEVNAALALRFEATIAKATQ